MATLITGGTGFVGQKLVRRLDNVIVTSRNRERASKKLAAAGIPDQKIEVIEWDPSKDVLEIPDGTQFDSVVNLMGESIAEGRWTEAKKERIRTSRVDGTRNLVDGIIKSSEQSGNFPSVFVSASAIGIYGDSGEEIVEEDHQKGNGFLTEVCQQWEAEALRLEKYGVRVVCLRIGIVLGESGGALEKMVPLFKWGVGGKLGSGKQWMAWIHVDDLVSLICWSLTHSTIAGPVNATAPNPVRNSEFTKTLASAVGRPAILPAPKFGLRLVLGEFANSLFFSQRIVPAAALKHGFQFKHSEVGSAIESALEAMNSDSANSN